MANLRPLPLDLVSLIHHVELNDAGWNRRAIEQILIATIYRQPYNLEQEEVRTKAAESFGLRVQAQELERSISSLISKGTLVRLPSGRLKISEEESKNIGVAIRHGKELEERVKEHFFDICSQHCIDLDRDVLWRRFQEGFLLPLLGELGARTYEFISGERIGLGEVETYRLFISTFPEAHQEGLRDALNDFFSSSDADIRSYVLENLHARFLVDASNLRQESLQALTKRMKNGVEIVAFADTNFLFSILDLHENPANESALALFDLAEGLKGKVSLKFCVLPITLYELRKTLVAYQSNLSAIRLSEPMSQAAQG